MYMLQFYSTWQGIYKNLQIPMAVLAIDTLGCSPVTSKGNRLALIAVCLHTSSAFMVPMGRGQLQMLFNAYLLGILANSGSGVVILSDNGTYFKSKVLNEACDQLGIKRIFSNPFHP